MISIIEKWVLLGKLSLNYFYYRKQLDFYSLYRNEFAIISSFTNTFGMNFTIEND